MFSKYKFYYIFSFLIFWYQPVISQFNLPASNLYNQLKGLATVGTVLYIAAHPDDENTRLISYLVGEQHLRTAYLSLTRGDGGQNLIGSQLGDQLGLIRTQELLAARRVDGAEQYFTRAIDFGYSKSPKETLQQWGTADVLSDVVYAVRKLKPDLIICRFPTTGEGGHGHHTASAILADSAFEIANNPQRYPESSRAFGAWQPATLLWNTFNFGSTNTTAPDQLKTDIGIYNPLLGMGYGEVASLSRSMHKSQGFGAAINRGEQLEYFKFIKGKTPENKLFDNPAFRWERFGKQGATIQKKVHTLINNFQLNAPEKSIASLIELKKYLLNIKNTDAIFKHYINLKCNEIDNLILKCAGLTAEFNTAKSFVLHGDTLLTELSIIPAASDQLKLLSIHFQDPKDTIINTALSMHNILNLKHKYIVNGDPAQSTAYWLQYPNNGRLHQVPEFDLIGLALGKPLFGCLITLAINNDTLSIPLELKYKFVDPIRGELRQPVYILPDVYVTDIPEKILFADAQAQTFSFRLYNNKPDAKGSIHFQINKNYKLSTTEIPYSFNSIGESKEININITPDIVNKLTVNNTAYLQITANEQKAIQQEMIRYDHIPPQAYIREVKINLENYSMLSGNNKKVAYIPGAGDKVAEALTAAGYQVTIIDANDLPKTDLSPYQAIITGIRAYNVNETLFGMHDQLMNYIRQGGNLIVQYNTNSRIGPLRGQIGPYPFTISRDRVTEEHATVTFTAPEDPALNYPNKITAADFNGWVQERGIYFVSTYDPAYRTIFSMHDTDEKPLLGSTIIGSFGKGNFVYTGLVFFRELPAGVPGAFRLISNLINLPPNE